MAGLTSSQFEKASIYSDLNSLDQIRQQGQVDQIGAIKKAAKEFEAFFMNMMLKSMRQASDVIGADSPIHSQQEKMYVSMLDEQLSVNLSQDGHLRIADMMVEQLTRQYRKSNQSLPTQYHLDKVNPKVNLANDSVRPKSLVNKNTDGVPVTPDIITGRADSNIFADATKQSIQPTIQSVMQPEPIVTAVSQTENVKPSKKPIFERISDFVNELMPYAVDAAKKLNLDPKLLIAQAALETGWGKFVMHDEKGQPGFNLFGIKSSNSWQGESIEIDTLEVKDSEFKKVNASFRKYQSFAESFQDYVDFILGNPRYKNAVESAPDAKAYVNALQNSGYATDPNYAKKIMRIFEEPNVQGANVGFK